MSKAKQHIEITDQDYIDADMAHLRETLQLSYKERFLIATRLYKINKTLQKVTITHKPFIAK